MNGAQVRAEKGLSMHRLAALILFVCLWVPAAKAENDQMHLVAGFAPGGTSSTAALFLADAVGSLTGKRVLVENRPGAGGFVAADWVKDRRNSRTLYVMSSTSSAMVPPALGLVPVGIFATYEFVAVVRATAPSNLESYMSESKTDIGLRVFGTSGEGSVAHLLGLRLFEAYGIPATHVPYRGSAPAIDAVGGSHIPMAIVPMPDVRSRQTELRELALSGKEIPAAGWMGLYAPRGTTTEEVEKIVSILRPAAEQARLKFAGVGLVPIWKGAEELKAMHAKEFDQWLPRLRALNVSLPF